MVVDVDAVQMVPDGFGFHIRAGMYTWIRLVYETKEAAEDAHGHASKAVAHAKTAKIVHK